MTTRTKGLMAFTTILTTAACAFAAHDVEINFASEGPSSGQICTIQKDGVTFSYSSDSNGNGVFLYNRDWSSYYYLTIAAPREIAAIEYVGKLSSATRSDKLEFSSGSYECKDDGIGVLTGTATKTLRVVAGETTTGYYLMRMRIWYKGSEYEHTNWASEGGSQGGGKFDVDLTHDKTDYSTRDRVYSPVNVLPVNGQGVPMAVVSNRMFAKMLQPYLKWKTQQGYQVTELYTDEIKTGEKDEALAHALRKRLMEMDPRPAYVLIVGDTDQVPCFMNTGRDCQHATDFFYGEYTDDRFADAYVGRFSATSEDELKPQLDKTEHMAKLDPAKGAWLKRSLTISNVTSDISKMKNSAEFSASYPLNFPGNTSRTMDASENRNINDYINAGASFMNYFGHGSPTSWSMRYYSSATDGLTNKDMYPVVASVTCETGWYDLYGGPCLAEVLMRKKDSGAVAVVASSRKSYSDMNDKFFSGHAQSQEPARLGFFRSLFPAVGDDPSQRARTLGQAVQVGTFATVRYSEPNYLTEHTLYQVFGDPTYQPYITTPKANGISIAEGGVLPGSVLTVNTAPEAMVALSQDRKVIVAGVADTNGVAKLYVPVAKASGDCTLYSSAPGYNDVSRQVTLVAGVGTDTPPAALPRVTHRDVISRQTVGTAVGDDWPSVQHALAGQDSGAEYAIFAASEKASDAPGQALRPWHEPNAESRSIYLRNNWNPCSIITTKKGGKARFVTVEWLHPTGKTEVLGVYGSDKPYSSTRDAWEGGREGKKLGELSNSTTSTLVIDEDYEYLLFRAEPFKQLPNNQSSVFLTSLKIGWDDGSVATVSPGGTLEVAAENADEAVRMAEIVVADSAAERAGQKSVLKVVATESKQKGRWILTAEIDPEKMPKGKKVEDATAALASALPELRLDANALTPGLYYSIVCSDSLDFSTADVTEPQLAEPGKTLEIPSSKSNSNVRFFKVKASMTAQGE